MGFNFNYPLVLLFLPVIAVYIIYMSKRMTRITKAKKRIVTTIRITVITLLLLSLSGFGVKTVSHDITTVFVVDVSDSIRGSKHLAEDFIKEAIKDKKNTDKVGVLSFGENVSVELIPSNNPNFSSLQSVINTGFTNIENALVHSISMIPSEDKKRVVLISDGEENAGDALKGVNLLKGQSIALDVFSLEGIRGSEVQLSEVKTPYSVKLNEKFEVLVKIESNVKTNSNIKLYRDRQLISQSTVEIQRGENNFVFSDTSAKGGMVTYRVEIEPDDDTLSQNNKVASFLHVEDVAHILIIEDENEGAIELTKILEDEGNVTVLSPESVPVSLDQLQKYDGFVISNVPYERFDVRFLNNLEISIRNMGKGLLVTGGEDSYALGGYHDTVFEKILPVNMDIKNEEEIPNLGLVLVIDKSGSMTSGRYGISAMELAKEAAIRSLEALKKDDMIGVIAFDHNVEWVVKTQKINDLKAIQNKIASIRAGGGTTILPSLEEAYNSIKDIDTKLKHIILLTDGMAERTGYEPLIEGMNENGITLSTVAIGDMSDTKLLIDLAKNGNGRYYYTDEFSDIPSIFAKETFLAGKTYINNKQFTPVLRSYSPILDEIKSIPDLYGYVRTTPKVASRIIFSSDEEDPILSTWQYGLGRTAAWTSDAKGMWTGDWMEWQQSPRFWKNLISWLLQQKVRDDYIVSGGIKDGTGYIELIVPPDEIIEGGSIEAVLISPSGSEEKSNLKAVSPGVYRGAFSADETGVYVTNVSISKEDNVLNYVAGGIVVPYSPEYSISRTDGISLLERIVFESGGRIIKSPKEVFKGEVAYNQSINDITNLLLLLAVILLMIDITIRRINIPFRKVEVLFERVETSISIIINKVKDKVDVRKKEITLHKVEEVREETFKSKENKEKSGNNNHISKLLESKRKRK